MSKLIGTNPNQVPTNADLGTMAYLDADQMIPYLKGGRRNLIINGDFRVRQRGSTLPDRWFNMVGMSVDGSVTSHFKFTSTSADPYQWYKVEDVGMSLAGKVATWSFWAKSSDGGNPIQYFAYTGSSTSGQIFPTPTGETDSAGFSRFVFQITLDSTTYTDRHEFRFEYRAVSGITIEIKEVQLELGSVATPFEHRSYGEELALCQRYYQYVDAGAGYYFVKWYFDDKHYAYYPNLPVAMRAPATANTTNNGTLHIPGEAIDSVSSVTINAEQAPNSIISIDVVNSVARSGISAQLTSGKVYLDAEL